MKVLFINPPVIRDDNSSPENDFKIKGFVFKSFYRKIPGVYRLFKFLNKYYGLGKGVRYGVRAGSRWPWTMEIPPGALHYPFIMAYAASYLRSKGFEVNILDAVAEEEYDYDKFLDKIKKEAPDIVIAECSTPTIDIDVWFAKKVAKFFKVALAGSHLNEETIKEIQHNAPEIKYFLCGEYILNTYELVKSRKEGVYPSKVVEDLDSIPFPFRDYKSATKYYDPTMPTKRPQLQIYSSKGCPFRCVFCMWPQIMYHGVVSLRRPQKVYEEINECIRKYGFKSIFFDDDTFNIGTERISLLCDYLKKIGLPWTMMGRIDISPDWLFDKMVDSGCVGMRFGVETFNLDVLRRINKGIERIDFKSTLNRISKKYPGLMIHLTMMKDLPGQSEEIHNEDMKILKAMGFSESNIFRSYQIASCAPFPGTRLYEELKSKVDVEILKDYKSYDGSKDTVMKRIG
ncbi:MAG: B12-binding domain-containing radical SAM protein [Elusimicrobiota bacterium]